MSPCLDQLLAFFDYPATGERMRFASAMLPPWARKTPRVTEVLPLLYLHGLSTGALVS